MHRRDLLTLLAAGAAGAALPGVRAATSGEPDVLVIGAGAAGIAAARELMAAGRSVEVLEAAPRVGGRAWTDTSTFGVPFDQGCSWITSSNVNPLAAMARARGFELLRHDEPGEALFVRGRRASAAERRQYDRAWGMVNAALDGAGRKGLDVPASSVMPAAMPFLGVSQTWIGPMDMGVDFKDLSTLDFYNGASIKPSFMIKEGYGTLIAQLAGDVPVRLSAPVTKVDWSGRGVTVETTAGTRRARSVIVTVSTGVLGSEAIRFVPALPDWKQQAVNDVPMGLLAKIALRFDGERFGLRANEWLTHDVPDVGLPVPACFFLSWPFDFDLLVGFVGGDVGFELSSAGPQAAVDFGLERVVDMLGSDATRHFDKGTFTGWASNPLTLGAYAAPRPGRASARDALARPLGEKVFFAGEAVAGPYAATCGGAFMSGRSVAREVDARLAGAAA